MARLKHDSGQYTFVDPDGRVLDQCRGRFGIWFWADLFVVSYIPANEECQKQFQELRVAEKVRWVSASSWGIYHLRCFDSLHSSSAWSHESCHLSDAAHMWALDFQRSPTSSLIRVFVNGIHLDLQETQRKEKRFSAKEMKERLGLQW